MTDHFRVSIEGEQVERVLGELLVCRAFLSDVEGEVFVLDDRLMEAAGTPNRIALREPGEPSGPGAPWGPVGDVLDAPLRLLRDRLTAVIDFLRIDPG
jgi:hypothetical protein